MSIRYQINDFLFSKGFKLIKNDTSEHFGDFYFIYSNKVINIRLVSNRSIETLDFCSVLDTDRWIDLALIKALISNEQDSLKFATANELNRFLEKYFFEICELLSKQNYSSTKKKIEALENKRIKQMFPNI